jgi:hypothetical protein
LAPHAGQGGDGRTTTRTRATALALASLFACCLFPGQSLADVYDTSPDVQHLHFQYGPLHISPGANLILLGPDLQKPSQDGYLVRMKPNLVRTDGSVPPVDVIHLHHGVWLNGSGTDATSGGAERFFASGEEKTILRLPAPYGYPVRASDQWYLNYMIHDLTPNPDTVYLTYDLDFVPASSALGKTIKPARPIWMDVQNGSAYPVFDVHRGAGSGGSFTYPNQARAPYGSSHPLNEWTVDRPGTLVFTAGHVHPGGLHTDLELVRDGASVAQPVTGTGARTECPGRSLVQRRPSHRRRHRHRASGHRHARPRGSRARVRHPARGRSSPRGRHPSKRRRPRRDQTVACPPAGGSSGVAGPIPGTVPHSVRLFRSNAHYFDPHGPVSWDMAMGATSSNWRVGVKPGDRLRVSATYDTSRASWYESMGIMFVYMADDTSGPDPFKTPIDQTDNPTHGQYPENTHYGGEPTGLPDPNTLPDGQAPSNTVDISNFSFLPGDQGLSGGLNNPPVVHQGEQLNFVNQDAGSQIMHSITSCQAPCNVSTGASYPLANGPIDFDSGNLGYGPTGFTAASNRGSWSTPASLPPGTYTYFCRIHPFMHGSFRVIR